MATRKKIPEDCMPRCETCCFGEMDKKEGAGYCRRYPPQALTDEMGAGFSFPVIAAEDWCGEYQRRTN